jgi:LAO/AO transport system kinase
MNCPRDLAALPDADRLLCQTPAVGAGPAQRRALAKIITLLESTRADHRLRADALLNACCPPAAKRCAWASAACPAWARAPSSKPWASILVARGHRVAVLAVDPSSSISGGSILGDKTRMERWPCTNAPSSAPARQPATWAAWPRRRASRCCVCEAAGFDVVIVETVGVGQSETAVAGMTDLFLLLQLPNAGDDLQAIKKGVMELADLVVINKADLDEAAATRARAQITSALRLIGLHGHRGTSAQVLQLSALQGAQGWTPSGRP